MIFTIPAPLPTEHVSSILARIRRINVVRNKDRLPRALLSSKYSPTFTLAGHLKMSQESLARNHTCIPYMRAIFDDVHRSFGPNSKPYRAPMFGSYLGRNALQLPVELPRFCRRCLNEDVKKHGFSFWRTTHQLPGVIVCNRHKYPLTEARVDPTTVLPSDFAQSASEDLLSTFEVEEDFPLSMAFRKLAVGLLELKYPIPHAVLRSRLTALAIRRGFEVYSGPYGLDENKLINFLSRKISEEMFNGRRNVHAYLHVGTRACTYSCPYKQIFEVICGMSLDTASACLAALALATAREPAISVFQYPKRLDLDGDGF